MKWTLIILSLLWTSVSFATPNHADCGQALPIDNANFCSSFKTVAQCHCTNSTKMPFFCRDMHKIYARMLVLFKTVEGACHYQKDVDPEVCINDWNCYLNGGTVDGKPDGKLCSGTGRKCE